MTDIPMMTNLAHAILGNKLSIESDAIGVRMLEDEIERLGLVESYQDALIAILGFDMQVFNSAIELSPFSDLPRVPNNQFEWDGHAYLWTFHRAEPKQRAQAFLQAISSAGQ